MLSAVARVRLLGVLLALILVQAWRGPSHARAWDARMVASAALMMSRDQIGYLGYDSAGLMLSGAISRDLRPRFAVQWGVRGGTFLAQHGNGGVLGSTLGLRLHSTPRPAVPYLSVDGGVALTGKLVRPWLGATFGVEWRVNDHVALGPVVGVDDIVQWNRPNNSTDAVFVWLGIAASYGSGALRTQPPPKTPPAQRVRPAPPAATTPPSPADEPGPALAEAELEQLIERTFPTGTTRVELLAPVLFALDSDEIEPVGIAMLHEVAHTLNTRREIRRLEVQGFTDERGNPSHNRELSRRRAERVRDWLIAHGVAPERLVVAPFGAKQPVERGADEAAHQQNRRVVFRVLEWADP